MDDDDDFDWSYANITEWDKYFPACAEGVSQSPIDIITGSLDTYTNVKSLTFHDYASTRPFILTNNGRTGTMYIYIYIYRKS